LSRLILNENTKIQTLPDLYAGRVKIYPEGSLIKTVDILV
jgi:hypothetical protein